MLLFSPRLCDNRLRNVTLLGITGFRIEISVFPVLRQMHRFMFTSLNYTVLLDKGLLSCQCTVLGR